MKDIIYISIFFFVSLYFFITTEKLKESVLTLENRIQSVEVKNNDFEKKERINETDIQKIKEYILEVKK